MDLVEFLLARVDEDEEVARAALNGVDGGGPGDRDRTAAHVGRWNPARVLAECEAKRGAVEVLRTSPHASPLTGARALEILALPYADHPEYDERWRPRGLS